MIRDVVPEHRQHDKVVIPERAIVLCEAGHFWYVPKAKFDAWLKDV